MITLQQLLNARPIAAEMFREIGAANAAFYFIKDGSLCFGTKGYLVSEKAAHLLGECLGKNTEASELFMFSRVLGEGPKIFRPNKMDFARLELIDLNINFEDYAQPFPNMVIELPEGYAPNVLCPQTGREHGGQIMPLQHSPQLVILHHDPKLNMILASVIFSSELSIKTVFAPKANECIEEYLDGYFVHNFFDDSLDTTAEEWDLTKRVIKAAFNYALLVMQFGCQCVGPENERMHRRLQHFVEAATKRKNPEQIAKAKANLSMHGFIYQHIKIMRSENGETIEHTGYTVGPHHRRGYYKMQPYGPKNSLRKRIQIPPCFVNAHLFDGPMSNTHVQYE